MIDLITDLNPYFTYPYKIGILLLPETNNQYENLTNLEANKHIQEAIKLGLKGVLNTCNNTKISLINQEFDLRKLWTDEKYKNPCIDPDIPYYLAYVYYWGLHDSLNASKYYRIASANTNAVAGSRIMAAIMQGKSGDRERAIIMFLSLAESIS